jgi:hypothetical protein
MLVNGHQATFWKKWKWLIVLSVGIVSAFTVLLAAASWMSREKQQARITLMKYDDALVAKEYDLAFSLRDPELRRLLSESDFEKSHEIAESHYGRLNRITLEPGEKVGDQNGMTVVINAEVIYANAEDHFAVTMKKEGNLWFVHDYRYQAK